MRKKYITGNKGFTLIELLVVVAIIGILAAVGVVAYNGYTASAKANSSKANYKQYINYANSLLMKCHMGENKIELKVNTHSLPQTYNCNDAIQNFKSFCNSFGDYKKAKNPYRPDQPSFRAGAPGNTPSDLGYVDMWTVGSSSKAPINVSVMYKDGETLTTQLQLA